MIADTLHRMSAAVRPRRARAQGDSNAQPENWIQASDPHALSDTAAFALLVLALAGVIGLTVVAVAGVLQQFG